jgi:hypothetical protein
MRCPRIRACRLESSDTRGQPSGPTDSPCRLLSTVDEAEERRRRWITSAITPRKSTVPPHRTYGTASRSTTTACIRLHFKKHSRSLSTRPPAASIPQGGRGPVHWDASAVSRSGTRARLCWHGSPRSCWPRVCPRRSVASLQPITRYPGPTPSGRCRGSLHRARRHGAGRQDVAG